MMTPQHMNQKPPPADQEGSALDAAAYSHVDDARERADGENPYPYWHGWALREAFIAGTKWQETRSRKEPGK